MYALDALARRLHDFALYIDNILYYGGSAELEPGTDLIPNPTIDALANGVQWISDWLNHSVAPQFHDGSTFFLACGMAMIISVSLWYIVDYLDRPAAPASQTFEPPAPERSQWPSSLLELEPILLLVSGFVHIYMVMLKNDEENYGILLERLWWFEHLRLLITMLQMLESLAWSAAAHMPAWKQSTYGTFRVIVREAIESSQWLLCILDLFQYDSKYGNARVANYGGFGAMWFYSVMLFNLSRKFEQHMVTILEGRTLTERTTVAH